MPGDLNKFNFLRWNGSFDKAVLTNTAVDDAANGTVSDGFVSISILDNDVSTLGIDFSTITITQQVYLDKPALWDQVNKILNFYLKNTAAGVYQLKYKWQDVGGNYSNEANINITIAARNTAWRGYQTSLSCELDANNVKTGNSKYATLEQYYTDEQDPTGLYKNNIIGDPDYIAPAADPVNCGAGGGSDGGPATGSSSMIMYYSGTGTSEDPLLSCSFLNDPAHAYTVYIANTDGLKIGTQLYNDAALTIILPQGSYAIFNKTYNVSAQGIIYSIMTCN